MPRLTRLDAPGVLHHVMGRGIERRDIYSSAVVKAREVLSWVAVRELGYSAEVARYLGVTTPCINRSISSVKKPDVEDLIESL